MVMKQSLATFGARWRQLEPHTSSDFPGKRSASPFGMELVLARPGDGVSDQHTPVNRAEALWGRE
ncbi:hypothetical protein ACTG9Q_31845 [Actinokineospora sp. 24-640]